MPGLEGRFPCVSGVWFKYNPKLPEGSWIDPADVTVNGKQLDLKKLYTVTTKSYLAGGKDGYTEFLHMKVIRDDE